MSTNDPNAQPFVKGDIVRTEDPEFEMVYQKLAVADFPVIGAASVLNASNEAIIADEAVEITKKISVRTSFVDREESTPTQPVVGMLQRGYIVMEAGGTLLVDAKVKPDATGDPITADPATDLGEIFGIVIGKANLNNQTLRVDAADTELVIIKVGDY